jgi:hypothetical protein
MVLFGAPYYCLELYVAYTGRRPSDLVLALAGGAAVAPSSLDPWIFLLFWANWSQPPSLTNSRRLMNLSSPPREKKCVQTRRTIRVNTLGTSSSSDGRQKQKPNPIGQPRLPPYTIRWNTSTKKREQI